MYLTAMIGRLGSTVEARGTIYTRERFLDYTVARSTQLLDRHDGEPLAGLRSWREDIDGTVYGTFDSHPGCAGRIRDLAERSRALSMEFTAARRTVAENVTRYGGSEARWIGAEVTALAFAPDPARDDCRIVGMLGGDDEPVRVQTRSAAPGTIGTEAMPAAVRRRYFDGQGRPKVCYGPPRSTPIRLL